MRNFSGGLCTKGAPKPGVPQHEAHFAAAKQGVRLCTRRQVNKYLASLPAPERA